MVEFDEFLAGGKAAFEAQWTTGAVLGWGNGARAGPNEEEEEGIDLEPFETAEALADAIGMEDLKEELARLGLKVSHIKRYTTVASWESLWSNTVLLCSVVATCSSEQIACS